MPFQVGPSEIVVLVLWAITASLVIGRLVRSKASAYAARVPQTVQKRAPSVSGAPQPVQFRPVDDCAGAVVAGCAVAGAWTAG